VESPSNDRLSHFVACPSLLRQVVPEQSRHELLKTKLEVRLAKAAPGAWPTLQASGAPQPAASFADPALAHPPSYPSSRRAAGRALACPGLAHALLVQQPCLPAAASVVGARPRVAHCRPFQGQHWAGACTAVHQVCAGRAHARARPHAACLLISDLVGAVFWGADSGGRSWARHAHGNVKRVL
jgi:hypothetical protein